LFSIGINPIVEGEISFGRFRLDLARRELRRDQKPVRLGSRALDILCVLASAGGKVVTTLFEECQERRYCGRTGTLGVLNQLG
jgi:DNA-binding winged helix-turn-helix (wHTH) protein